MSETPESLTEVAVSSEPVSGESMDYRYSPIYLLRTYAWEVLKRNTNMSEADYGGLVPIVPLSEEPEISEYDGAHIVYGYALNSTGDLHARKTGSMTFAVYETNFRTLTNILTILTTAFERQDETARDINEWSSTIPQFVGITFGTVDIGFVEGGTPEDTEGGRQSGLLNIRFEYHVKYNVITKLV